VADVKKIFGILIDGFFHFIILAYKIHFTISNLQLTISAFQSNFATPTLQFAVYYIYLQECVS